MLIDFNPDVINDPEEAFRAADNFGLLATYCAHKGHAIRRRMVGDVQGALDQEAYCDKIYAQLPDDLRW